MTQTPNANPRMRKAATAHRISMGALIAAIPLGVIFGLGCYGLVSLPHELVMLVVVSLIALILSHFVLRIISARFTTQTTSINASDIGDKR